VIPHLLRSHHDRMCQYRVGSGAGLHPAVYFSLGACACVHVRVCSKPYAGQEGDRVVQDSWCWLRQGRANS
jgi:hypothetical protein